MIQRLVQPRFSKIVSDECGKAFSAIPQKVVLEEDWDGFVIRVGEKASRVPLATIQRCVELDAYAELDEAVRASVREVIA
jgi:hypothetical protein